MADRPPQYAISFPQRSEQGSEEHIDQHEEIVDVTFLDAQPKRTERFRIQDYADVFAHPGLYEKIVHEELRCQFPEVMVRLLCQTLAALQFSRHPGQYQQHDRVLDIAAGNGIVGEEIRRQLQGQIAYLAGADLLPAARAVVSRDRPGIYDSYVVAHLGEMDMQGIMEVFGANVQFDIISMCAALGFEPALLALLTAVKMLRVGGFVAICVNELSFENTQEGVWGAFMRTLAEKRADAWQGMRELARKRYLHRFDVRGRIITYVAAVFQKEAASDEENQDD